MIRTLIISLVVLITLSNIVIAQASSDTVKSKIVQLHVPYSFNFPGGDLKNRFAKHSEIGLGFERGKGNWSAFLSANFIFGRVVKDTSLFNNITNSAGEITNTSGEYADIRLYERGYNLFAGANYKIWSNRYLSIKTSGQVGYLNHKIRIEVIGNNVPQLSPQYLKGYDRMAGGLAFREMISLNYNGDKSLAKFYLGLELTQGFTKNVRTYDYSTMSSWSEERFDNYFAVKFGWIISMTKQRENKFYTY